MRSKPFALLLTALLASVALAGCTASAEESTLTLYVKDAPTDELDQLLVTFTGFDVLPAGDNASWEPVLQSPFEVDLLDYQGTEKAQWDQVDLPYGAYQAVRIVFGNVSAVYPDGNVTQLAVLADSLEIQQAFVVSESESSLLLDLDVDASVDLDALTFTPTPRSLETSDQDLDGDGVNDVDDTDDDNDGLEDHEEDRARPAHSHRHYWGLCTAYSNFSDRHERFHDRWDRYNQSANGSAEESEDDEEEERNWTAHHARIHNQSGVAFQRLLQHAEASNQTIEAFCDAQPHPSEQRWKRGEGRMPEHVRERMEARDERREEAQERREAAQERREDAQERREDAQERREDAQERREAAQDRRDRDE